MSNMTKKKRRHPQGAYAAGRSQAVRASSGRTSSGRSSSVKSSSVRPSSVRPSSVRSSSGRSSSGRPQKESAVSPVKRNRKIIEPAFRKPKKPRLSPLEMLRLHKSILILVFTIGLIVLLGIGGIQYVRSHYRVKTANVVGNTYYTDEEIQDMVMNGMFAHNSLYLSFKYHNKSIVNIPFIEKITVDIKSADTIDIRVYEKALAGCISYLENYMYFDREGIIVEGSSELLEGVPVVKGLKFDSVVLYEALPVEDKSVFSEILDLTQLLSKYSLSADQMYFDKGYNVYLYFDNIEVAIGSKKNIDEKVIQLPYILPSLEGKKGTLHLEDYDENTESVRFEEAS
ncbi:cell division protein FtsQ [Butyrivibrio fibrisolvens DSM 3071]|uniref:Cell division protein FtsQ n=1 Tax=Butyrivibrio fibrisolvens DSM 3071 TaxID=1121131 RepID=A0A1M5TTN7_BUTFI|nr:cell division protein FtsQ [Butyrivibrio fibrisolvens]SHH54069.1 cell division protein FtsQ [Butyrivibrio fibrisolvens DSM 3071]